MDKITIERLNSLQSARNLYEKALETLEDSGRLYVRVYLEELNSFIYRQVCTDEDVPNFKQLVKEFVEKRLSEVSKEIEDL